MTAEYRLTVEAVDGGSPPLSGSVAVVVRVLDANDNSPVFDRESYDVAIAENVRQMTTIAQVNYRCDYLCAHCGQCQSTLWHRLLAVLLPQIRILLHTTSCSYYV